ncbi:MAG: 3,4-dehydroadipyl-CoA semialdehyde dehydrogenase [Gemmatimonadota bacterium]
MIKLKSFVNGTWQEGTGKPSVLVDPSTEEPIAESSTEGLDFAGAVRYARDVGGPALRSLSPAGRAGLLKAMSKALGEHRDELLDMAMKNGGNTKSDAKFDVDGASGTLGAYAHFGKALGDARLMSDGDAVPLSRDGDWVGRHALVPKEGVAVLVNAFNFPAWGFGEKAACALLAGMPVIVKPATSTALVTWRMVEILDQAGVLPEGSVQLVAGAPGDLLSHLGAQDVLAFTGSADTGLHLRSMEEILERNVTVNVEADSLNSAVLAPGVDPDSDLYTLFLNDVVREITQKTGQKCTAVRRIFVPADAVERVSADLVARLEAVVVGNTADPSVTMGPVTTARQLRDNRAGIDALAAAGTVLLGGSEPVDGVGAPKGKGYYVRPTLVRFDSARAAKVVHEREVFGPVSSILPYDGTPEEAAELVALGNGSLVASAYGDDPDWLEGIVTGFAQWNGRIYLGSSGVTGSALGSGMVMPALMHGGPGRAGNGAELGGLSGLRLYQRRSAVQGDPKVLQGIFGEGTDA